LTRVCNANVAANHKVVNSKKRNNQDPIWSRLYLELQIWRQRCTGFNQDCFEVW
jgi:hypothetical protein